MRSVAFLSTLLFIFPVLISGFPFLRRDGNATDTSSNSTSTSNSTSAPINGEPVNSTSSTAPTGGNNTTAPTGSNNTTDSSNSTSSAVSDLATSLMTLTLLMAGSFYEQSAVISQGLGDSNASALLGAAALINAAQLNSLNPTANDLNCTFDVNNLMDKSNTAILIDSIVYVESIKAMGSANLLSNTSLNLSQTEQDIFSDIYQNAHQLSGLAANITLPAVPLGSYPNLTQEDYTSLLVKSTPSCLNDLGLQNLPSHPAVGLGAPHAFTSPFVLGTVTTGCPDLSAVFCQEITAGPNATTVVSPQNGTCFMQAPPGPVLFYNTRTADPLPVDPAERQAQDGNICAGPDVLFLFG